MASLPKEHETLYFDTLVRTKKGETVLSLIKATYNAYKSKNTDNKADIAARLKSAYELYKPSTAIGATGAGTYSGSESQFESQYTIGHEMAIWHDSDLHLNYEAMLVACDIITIKDYFDLVFLNYVQLISGKVYHPLYSILMYLINHSTDKIDFKDISQLFDGKCDDEQARSLANFMCATNYFEIIKIKNVSYLKYVFSDTSMDELLSKCNTRYLSSDGYEKIKLELNDSNSYENYIFSRKNNNVLFDGISKEDVNSLFRNWLKSNLNSEPSDGYNGYSSMLFRIFDILENNGILNKDSFRCNNIYSYPIFKEMFLENAEAVDADNSQRGNGKAAFPYYIDFINQAIKYGYDELLKGVDNNLFIKDLKPINSVQNVNAEKEYSVEELAKILKDMSSKYDQVLAIHLFGIKFGNLIRKKKYSVKEIISKSELPDSYFVELNKGIKLSGYVEERKNIEEIDLEDISAPTPQIKSYNYEDSSIVSGGKNIIYYGTPGCGKSHYVDKKYNIPGNNVFRTVFHPEYSFTDFVGQIVPKLDDKNVYYEFNQGIFTKAFKCAIEHKESNVILIIEEINRGNAAAIFGEIFQLLDRYSSGLSKFEIDNPYISKEVFNDEKIKVRLPKNLSIIATMNTSDQNVYTLDTAFKRRWDMVKIRNTFDDIDVPSIPEELAFKNKISKMYIPNSDVTWRDFVEKVNNKISKKDRSFGITSEDKELGVYFVGEKYLCSDKFDKDKTKLSIFAEKVIMYIWNDVARLDPKQWFGDYSTLDEVLNAFEKEDSDNSLNVFTLFNKAPSDLDNPDGDENE